MIQSGDFVGEFSALQLSSRGGVWGGSWSSSLLGAVLTLSGRSVGLLVGLVGAVDGDLDSNFSSLDLLAIHLVDSLLLQLLRRQCDETETTTLAGLTTCLELLDHEAGDGPQGNLGRGRLVGAEELLELQRRTESAQMLTLHLKFSHTFSSVRS